MKLCPYCDTFLRDQANFCTVCGRQVVDELPRDIALLRNWGIRIVKIPSHEDSHDENEETGL